MINWKKLRKNQTESEPFVSPDEGNITWFPNSDGYSASAFRQNFHPTNYFFFIRNLDNRLKSNYTEIAGTGLFALKLVKSPGEIKVILTINANNTLNAIVEEQVTISSEIKFALEFRKSDRSIWKKTFKVSLKNVENFDPMSVAGFDIGTCSSTMALLENDQPEPILNKHIIPIPNNDDEIDAKQKILARISSQTLQNKLEGFLTRTQLESMSSIVDLNVYLNTLNGSNSRDVSKIYLARELQNASYSLFTFFNLKRIIESGVKIHPKLEESGLIADPLLKVFGRMHEIIVEYLQNKEKSQAAAIVFSVPNSVSGHRLQAYYKAAQSGDFPKVMIIHEAEASLIGNMLYGFDTDANYRNLTAKEIIRKNLESLVNAKSLKLDDKNTSPIFLIIDQGAGSLDIALLSVYYEHNCLIIQTKYSNSHFYAGDDLDYDIAHFMKELIKNDPLAYNLKLNWGLSIDEIFSGNKEDLSKKIGVDARVNIGNALNAIVLKRILFKILGELVKKNYIENNFSIKKLELYKNIFSDISQEDLSEVFKSISDIEEFSLNQEELDTYLNGPDRTIANSWKALNDPFKIIKEENLLPRLFIIFSGRTTAFPPLYQMYKDAFIYNLFNNEENFRQHTALSPDPTDNFTVRAKYSVALGSALYGRAATASPPWMQIRLAKSPVSVGLYNNQMNFAPLISWNLDCAADGLFRGRCILPVSSDDNIHLYFFKDPPKELTQYCRELNIAEFPGKQVLIYPQPLYQSALVLFEIEIDLKTDSFFLYQYQGFEFWNEGEFPDDAQAAEITELMSNHNGCRIPIKDGQGRSCIPLPNLRSRSSVENPNLLWPSLLTK